MFIFQIECGKAVLRRRIKSRYRYFDTGVCCGALGPFLCLYLSNLGSFPGRIRSDAARLYGFMHKGKLYCIETLISLEAVLFSLMFSIGAALLFGHRSGDRLAIFLLFFLLMTGVTMLVSYLDTHRNDYISELLSAVKELCEEPEDRKG